MDLMLVVSQANAQSEDLAAEVEADDGCAGALCCNTRCVRENAAGAGKELQEVVSTELLKALYNSVRAGGGNPRPFRSLPMLRWRTIPTAGWANIRVGRAIVFTAWRDRSWSSSIFPAN